MEYDWALEDRETKTLDAYGWLDENGGPDFDRAKRELERVKRLKNGN